MITVTRTTRIRHPVSLHERPDGEPLVDRFTAAEWRDLHAGRTTEQLYRDHGFAVLTHGTDDDGVERLVVERPWHQDATQMVVTEVEMRRTP